MDFDERETLLAATFTPRSPVNQRQLFSGRIAQLAKVESAIRSPGTHAILYGERGVGKTSLANVIAEIAPLSSRATAIKVTCNAGDDYSAVWRRAFAKIVFSKTTKSIGFITEDKKEVQSFADTLPAKLSPDDVESALKSLSVVGKLFIIFDEFDRVKGSGQRLSLPFSDTIKSLSDNGFDVTILVVGVADSVEKLDR